MKREAFRFERPHALPELDALFCGQFSTLLTLQVVVFRCSYREIADEILPDAFVFLVSLCGLIGIGVMELCV